MSTKNVAPMLFPYEPEEFWNIMRAMIREEINKSSSQKTNDNPIKVDGLTNRPLLKVAEVCSLFRVSRPTIYDWIKHGKLKPYKIRKSVYFLWNDIIQIMPIKEEAA